MGFFGARGERSSFARGNTGAIFSARSQVVLGNACLPKLYFGHFGGESVGGRRHLRCGGSTTAGQGGVPKYNLGTRDAYFRTRAFLAPTPGCIRYWERNPVVALV